jgi:hypothetical protein
MVGRRSFAHVNPDGRDLTFRVRSAGDLRGVRDWAVGEDLAWGRRTS